MCSNKHFLSSKWHWFLTLFLVRLIILFLSSLLLILLIPRRFSVEMSLIYGNTVSPALHHHPVKTFKDLNKKIHLEERNRMLLVTIRTFWHIGCFCCEERDF